MVNTHSLNTSLDGSPLSVVAPVTDRQRNDERIKALLRHPRSRIRITPGWRAPSLTVALRSATALVHASRHRVSPVMWEKLLDTAPPKDEPLFLVTISAMVDPESLTGSVRDTTIDIHSLFRSIAGNAAWIQREREGEDLVWTWHCLMTQDELEAAPLSAAQDAA